MVLLAYVSVDEVTTIHEWGIDPLRRLLGVGGLLYHAWVIPAAAGLVLVGVMYARFFWHLSARWKKLFLLSALLYVGGALGVESIGGWYVAQHGVTFTYSMIVSVEEALEMIGTVVFVYALLDYLATYVRGIEFVFSSRSGPDTKRRAQGQTEESSVSTV